MNKQLKTRSITLIAILVILIIAYNIPSFLCFSGKQSLKKNKAAQAYKALKPAYLLRPNNKDIRYYYVKSMTALKPVEHIQTEMFEIAEDKNHDSAQKLAQNQIEYWRTNILQNVGENYIEQAPYDKNLLRWDVNTFPLKIKIEVPISTPEYYRVEIEKAFTQWQISTDFLKFEFVDTGNADIYVKFEPLPDDICENGICKYVVGYTTPKIQGKILKSMTITLYDKDANGSFFSDKELYNTVLHEIGHSLGIMGHSYSSDDLMFMSSDQTKIGFTRIRSGLYGISTNDINTLNLLYKMIPDISNVPMTKFNKEGLIYAPIVLGNDRAIGARKLVEAQNYIKSAPEVPGGYIDLAIVYADMNKYPQAIDALRQALEVAKTDSDKYIIYFNIAAIHLNNNRVEEAQKYLNLAKSINDNNDIAELQSNINHAKASKKKPFKTPISN